MPQPPYHLQIARVGGVDFDLLPQVPDVHSHGVLAAQGGVVPHLLVNLGGGIHPAQVFHQQAQNVILNGGEAHRLCLIVHDDRAVAQSTVPLLRRNLAPQGGVPPQLALHPGQHLDGVEGLGDIVVRADVQPQHLIAVLALGGEQDDGDVAAGLPQPGGGPDAVQLGHHDIH